MKKGFLFGILSAALLASACSTLTTAVDYDHTINWSQFHTFQLAEGDKDVVTFTQKRIADAITGQLTSKGWQAVTSNPDIMVYTHGVRSTQTQWNATSMGGWGYRGWGGMGGGMATATETKIPVGTLVVDLVNPKTKELVWRGTASDQISASGAEEGQVQTAVAELFKNFPPQPGK
ncbi:MAG TPA: DUF4136 domain-containing protein [Thermoanaerobaculia bacterium]|nr:DUF4136 domain-containing protein [Thermoanaerobaculia bacterium]